MALEDNNQYQGIMPGDEICLDNKIFDCFSDEDSGTIKIDSSSPIGMLIFSRIDQTITNFLKFPVSTITK